MFWRLFFQWWNRRFGTRVRAVTQRPNVFSSEEGIRSSMPGFLEECFEAYLYALMNQSRERTIPPVNLARFIAQLKSINDLEQLEEVYLSPQGELRVVTKEFISHGHEVPVQWGRYKLTLALGNDTIYVQDEGRHHDGLSPNLFLHPALVLVPEAGLKDVPRDISYKDALREHRIRDAFQQVLTQLFDDSLGIPELSSVMYEALNTRR